MDNQILTVVAVTTSLAAIGFCVLAAIMHGQRDAFRKAYNALVPEANRSADEAARLEGVVAQCLRDLDEKDRTIETLEVHRLQLFSSLRPVDYALRRWAIQNPTRAIKDLPDLLSKAFVSGPNGRLVRLVPKVPTNG